MNIFKSINEELCSIHQLNKQHDNLIKNVLKEVIQDECKQAKRLTPPNYSFFLMGSAGRYEQSRESDQDNGIVFQYEKDLEFYIQVGEKVVERLASIGYPKCPGNVMCNSNTWRKSIDEWDLQLNEWIETNRWDTLRNLIIFLDSRHLAGNIQLLHKLREKVINRIRMDSKILNRLVDNTSRPKKSLGVFGQFIVENSGQHTGLYEFKDNLLLLYVNAIRILSVMHGINETSTLARLSSIIIESKRQEFLQMIYSNFVHLLFLRYQNAKNLEYGEDIYLNVKCLNNTDKKRLKKIIKDGYVLNEYVTTEVRKRLR